MLAAEAAYCALEDDLQHYLDTYESTHDYDEYHFDLDEIEHDPYVLLSLLCALHEGQWTIDEVQVTLQMLFDRQYILTEDVVVETRYRTETDTWTDEDGNSHTDTYQVPYDYYICTVTLGAQGLYNICTPTSSPKPGDLVFFKGTYDTPGVSHCGIYVGDGKMLHCGDPIGYANLNTSYWQSHFYAYGRLP